VLNAQPDAPNVLLIHHAQLALMAINLQTINVFKDVMMANIFPTELAKIAMMAVPNVTDLLAYLVLLNLLILKESVLLNAPINIIMTMELALNAAVLAEHAILRHNAKLAQRNCF